MALYAGAVPAPPRELPEPAAERDAAVRGTPARLRTAPLEEAQASLRPVRELTWERGGLYLRLTGPGSLGARGAVRDRGFDRPLSSAGRPAAIPAAPRLVSLPPMSEHHALPDRNLALELVRVTEAGALAAARLIGRGDKEAADQAAVDAMRAVLMACTWTASS